MINEPNFQLFLKNTRNWLTNQIDIIPFIEANNLQNINLDLNMSLSPVTDHKKNISKNDRINLIQQFYINNDINRQNEIRKTLLYNCFNNNISKIYLFNERLYTDHELGIKSDKIIQIIINKRLAFYDIFQEVEKNKITGYVIISNSDIFFDASLKRLYNCDLIDNQKIFCLNRFNYTSINLDSLELDLFGRPDCQDSWIYHTSINSKLMLIDNNNFQLGTPGCDNRIIYLFIKYGFKCYNEPYLIKSYHYHKTQIRNYNSNTIKVEKPYYAMFPVLEHEYCKTRFDKAFYEFNIIDENHRFGNYIREKLHNKSLIILPNIIRYESELVFKYINLKQNYLNPNLSNLKDEIDSFKVNTNGIYFSNIEDIDNYCHLYMSSFEKCDAYFWHQPWCKSYSNSNYFIEKNFKKNKMWSNVLNLNENKYINYWCKYLDNKKILIITNSDNCIDKYYEYFPNSQIIFLELSENNDSLQFTDKYSDICEKITISKDKFDIAYVCYPGLTNILKTYLCNIGKSSI